MESASSSLAKAITLPRKVEVELRHLRYFAVLAEELHFSHAAERLHIEQPPLSRAIKELEEDLGVVLFDRDRRGTKLTAAGSAFLQDTRLRIPRDGGHDSMLMADSVPA